MHFSVPKDGSGWASKPEATNQQQPPQQVQPQSQSVSQQRQASVSYSQASVSYLFFTFLLMF